MSMLSEIEKKIGKKIFFRKKRKSWYNVCLEENTKNIKKKS
jgi:hypothetical protein